MEQTYDIAVIGAGPVGLTLALGFGRLGLKVVLLDRISREQMLAPAHDGRTTALSQSSKKLLAALSAWHGMAEHAEPILDIKVCEAASPIMLDFDHSLLGTEPMGHIVENRLMRLALARAIDALPAGIVTWQQGAVADLAADADFAKLTLEDGTILQARLAAVADGKRSPLRARLGIDTKTLSYGQTAIVTMIRHEKPHKGVALERFYPAGPFAVLPMKDQQCSIVWSEPDAAARYYVQADDATFHAALAERIGGYLGEFTITGGRWSYPLMLQRASAYTAPRTALAGDTAHAIHPIAGQGVNLGMRDVALLLELVADQARLGLDIGDPALLKTYAQRRSVDTHAMMASTDLLNRLFSNNARPLKLLRNLGLAMFEKIPPLKRGAMRYAMGLSTPNAPRLLKGGDL